jgi:hypothetical protein
MDGIKWHEWKEVSMGELLELIVEFNSILDFESYRFRKCLETFIQDTFNRRAKDQGTRVVPALEDLLVDLLYLLIADEDVFRRHSVGERLIPTVVNKSDCEVWNPMTAAMVFSGGQTGNIK